MPTLEELDLLTTEQVCEALHVGRDVVLRLVHSGQLKALKITRKCYRYHRADVERFVRERDAAARGPEKSGPAAPMFSRKR